MLEKTLESLLDCKEIQPVNPKGISPEYSLEGLMLKLQLQYFGHLVQRTDSLEDWCWERLKARGKGEDRGWDGWMASLTLWTWVWVSSGSLWWTRRPGVLQSMGLQKVGHNWSDLAAAFHFRWPNYWSFSFSISPFHEYSGLISFRIDWLDLLAVQGTLKSLFQLHSSKASILWCSAFFMVQLLHPYMTSR